MKLHNGAFFNAFLFLIIENMNLVLETP